MNPTHTTISLAVDGAILTLAAIKRLFSNDYSMIWREQLTRGTQRIYAIETDLTKNQ